MSFDLYAWKRPLVGEDEASQLLDRFYDGNEHDVFERNEDVVRFYDELLEKYTTLESWSVMPERSDRLVALNFTWSVPGEVLDEVVALARKHDLVLYDPQGPNFHSPESLLEEPGEEPGLVRSTLRGVAMGGVILAVGIFLPVPVLDWVLIVVGAFMMFISLAGAVYWVRGGR